MNADEIMRALKSNAEVNPHAAVMMMAADLIENLQAQLAKYDEVAGEYGIDGKTMLTLAKSQIRTAQDNIKLREQLAASQRRERAAVEDIMCNDHCDVCMHKDSGTSCELADFECGECDDPVCICRCCRDEDKWEWRGATK